MVYKAPMPRESWFLSYALLGLAQSGLTPILLPLASRGVANAGLTYAAFALTGLLAPLFGSWGDRTGRHRDLLIAGSATAAVCFAAYIVAPPGLRILLAACAGAGAMAATTAGNVLAIQNQPEETWDARVGTLQRYISTGQVIGLVLAGLLASRHLGIGFLCAALALGAGAALAAVAAPARQPSDPAHKPAPKPLFGGEAGFPSAHRHHHLRIPQIPAHLARMHPSVRHLLIVWLVSYTMMNGVAVLFPVVMVRHYALTPIAPSAAYAVGVGISLLLYPPASGLAHRRGGGNVLMAGFAFRLALYAAMTVFGVLHGSWAGVLVLLAFALTQVVWPLLSVGANVLTVRLQPEARGENVGLFNAATSLAAAAGSALGGAIFGLFGFAVLAGLATAAIAVALVLAALWLKPPSRSHEPPHPPVPRKQP